MTKTKQEMTTIELMALRREYERMLAIANERNQWSQEFRLAEFIEAIDEILEEREED